MRQAFAELRKSQTETVECGVEFTLQPINLSQREEALGAMPFVARQFQCSKITLRRLCQHVASGSGIGQRKLDAYGEAFLEVINAFSQTTPDTNTVSETVRLLCKGMKPLTIAHERGLTISTIYAHLANAIEIGEIELEDVVDLNEQETKAILFLFGQHEGDSLKPIYEALEGQYTYGILRCFKASLTPCTN